MCCRHLGSGELRRPARAAILRGLYPALQRRMHLSPVVPQGVVVAVGSGRCAMEGVAGPRLSQRESTASAMPAEISADSCG